MDKAFDNFEWKNYPSTDTPINASNLNKINNGLDTVDDRVIALNDDLDDMSDVIGEAVETIGEAAIAPHDEGKCFRATNGKVYKALVDIDIDDVLTVGTNCVQTDIVSNLGEGGSSTGGHIILDSNDTVFTQRSKLKFNNATVTDDSTNDTTIVTPEGGSSGAFMCLVQTLTAGSTSVIFQNVPIGDYLVDIYTSTGVPHTSIDISTPGQVILTYEAQSADISVVLTIEEPPQYTVTTQTLTAGSTSVTFTNIPTTGNYLIDFYTSTGVAHTAMDISVPGQVTLTFDAQSSNITVFCKISEVPQS